MLDSLRHDLRYAVRALRRSPTFAVVAVLSLALGMGANTAIFSLINAVMLKTVRVSHPEQLLQVTMASPQFFSNPLWEQVRDRQDVLSSIFAYGRWSFNLAQGGEARYVNGQFVSGHYFDTLSVRSVLGRTLAPADDQRGCAGAAVLSYGFWQREYGGGSGVLGKTISLDNHSLEIVGVAEPRFTGIDVGATVDVLVPLCAEKIVHGETSNLDINVLPQNHLLYAWLRVIGRPKPGLSASQVAARMRALAPQIYRATLPRDWRPDEQAGYLSRTLDAQPVAKGLSFVRDQYSEVLLILMAISAIVLLIACANVANLLLARSAARQREIAIRMALGSGRSRLIRQLLTESLLLSAAGALLGVLFARWITRVLIASLGVFLDLAPDLRVLAFTGAIGIFTGLLFGIAPAWRGTRVQPLSAMKANSRGVIEGSKFGLGKWLVVAQVALSLLLIVGAGLMLSTFGRLVSLDPGFDRGRVLLMAVDLRSGNYTPERKRALYREILDRLRAMPGVRSAAASAITPICGCNYPAEILIEGSPGQSRADATISVNRVTDRYFETLGIPLVAGRDFSALDTPASPLVAIVNQSMAAKYFGAMNPIGRYYRTRDGHKLSAPVRIAGVVKDSKYGDLREDISPVAYLAWRQDAIPSPYANFELRTAGGAPTALIAGAKSAIAQVDRGISIEFTTLANQVDASIERERLLAVLSGSFGALALSLAMIGLYGVMSYNVARRRN